MGRTFRKRSHEHQTVTREIHAGRIDVAGCRPDIFTIGRRGFSGAFRSSYRTLGKTGLKVAGVGFGLGFAPDPEIISRAIDLDVNYFDTSRVYGQGASERIFGAAIKGKRDRILISITCSIRAVAVNNG